MISPKTAIIDKPEWYLNQTLKWINTKGEDKDPQTKQWLVLSLLELAKIRLSEDMSKLAKTIDEDEHSEALLVHIYNEVVQFTKQIRQLPGGVYSDLEEKHDLMSVFSDQILFEKIDHNEWEYSKRNLREIMSSTSKWDPVLEGDFVDNYRIPRCVDRFLLLIKSISDKVDCFNQLDCKFRLIDLQCSLFNKFLKFMKQSTENTSISKNIITDIFFFADDSTIDLSRILRVLNGTNCLRLILLEERRFIASSVKGKLDTDLKARLDRTTHEYVTYYNRLIDKVVNIYESTDCDLQKFLEFVRPKLAYGIYESVRDEASKIHQTFQTQTMLKGLSLGRE